MQFCQLLLVHLGQKLRKLCHIIIILLSANLGIDIIYCGTSLVVVFRGDLGESMVDTWVGGHVRNLFFCHARSLELSKELLRVFNADLGEEVVEVAHNLLLIGLEFGLSLQVSVDLSELCIVVVEIILRLSLSLYLGVDLSEHGLVIGAVIVLGVNLSLFVTAGR